MQKSKITKLHSSIAHNVYPELPLSGTNSNLIYFKLNNLPDNSRND